MWVGSLLISPLADRYGRKTIFIWSIVWYSFCTMIMALQTSGETLNIWRFLAGFGFGAQLVTMDAYIAEIVPPAARGRAFAFNQGVTFLAVPLAALMSWLLLPISTPLGDGWRSVVIIGGVGMAVGLYLRRALPESPRWLAARGRLAEAESVLLSIETQIEAQTGHLLPEPQGTQAGKPSRGRYFEIFSPRYVERTIMLSLFNAAQVIGFYGFAAWVPTLLVSRGVTITDSLEYSLVIAIANPFGPFLAMTFADRIERKLQIVGALALMGCFIAIFALASYGPLLVVLGVLFTLAANVMSYSYHAYQAELFPTRIRARGIGFVYSWSRLSAAFAGLMVGYFINNGGVPAIAVFIAVSISISVVIIAVFGPLTRERPLEMVSE
ncbi:MAG: hypothetical protein B7Z81_08310 [Acidocella sp. 20-61-6]|nr:MAG: hypothetical protein B7Z81_08310 [Acidocella sp. 20-61-6]